MNENDYIENSIFRLIKPIPDTYSRAGIQTNLDNKYKTSEKGRVNSFSRVSVFDKIPRLKVSHDVYLNQDGEEEKDYSSSYHFRSPMIDPSYLRLNKKSLSVTQRKREEDELRKRFNDYRQEKLSKAKAKSKGPDGPDVGRYNPNYKAIYQSVQTFRISPPSYQQELQLKLNQKLALQTAEKKKYDKLQREENKRSKRKVEWTIEAKSNSNGINEYSDLNNKEYDDKYIFSRNYLKKKYSERKVNNHSIKESHSNNQSTRENNSKRTSARSKVTSFRKKLKAKGISFDKVIGRENILTRRIKKEKMIDYNPNYDFILKDTKKTFVHYGDNKTNVRFRKSIQTRKAIFKFEIESGYSVMKIDQEEKLKQETKKREADSFGIMGLK